MSDLPADTLTTTIAAPLADEERAELAAHFGDHQRLNDDGVCATCHGIAAVERILADRAAAVVSVLATHNEHTAADALRDAAAELLATDEPPYLDCGYWLRARADRLAAVSPTPPDEQWECGPHANAWGGHDARCRRVAVSPTPPTHKEQA